mgnify:CR=1 FL=1
MAKPASIKIRLNSSADTGFFYVAKKNARTMTEKLVLKKYDPEGKVKWINRPPRSEGPGPRAGSFAFLAMPTGRIWP